MSVANQCFGRLVDDKIFGYFGDGKHKFHLELRCSRNAIAGTKLCGKCHEKPRELGKNHPVLLHGLIDEPPPPWSHIYEGVWYKAKVADYGQPSEEAMAKGKKAHLEATKGILEPVPLAAPAPAPTPSPTPTPPVRNVSTNSFFVDSPKEESPKKKRGRKPTVVTPTVQAAPIEIVQTMAIESNELVLDTYEVIKITLRRFVHEGTPYFMEPKKNKIYSVGADSRPSSYVGRWNPRNRTIHTDIPDSDQDQEDV